MRSSKRQPFHLLLLLSVFSAGLFAAAPTRAVEPADLGLSAGAFNLRSATRPEVGAEVRFGRHRFGWLPHFIPELSPVTGGFVNSQGVFYVYGGLRADIPLAAPWELSIQFAPGIYSHGSDGFKLGGPVEFRSGIEISRQVGDRQRLGLMLFHLSNAHIYVHNPGSESLVVTYHFHP
jgi:lipid A 3-O-deacylase